MLLRKKRTQTTAVSALRLLSLKDRITSARRPRMAMRSSSLGEHSASQKSKRFTSFVIMDIPQVQQMEGDKTEILQFSKFWHLRAPKSKQFHHSFQCSTAILPGMSFPNPSKGRRTCTRCTSQRLCQLLRFSISCISMSSAGGSTCNGTAFP